MLLSFPVYHCGGDYPSYEDLKPTISIVFSCDDSGFRLDILSESTIHIEDASSIFPPAHLAMHKLE
jgi:hypothetical protein